jgi:hypothetical protein
VFQGCCRGVAGVFQRSNKCVGGMLVECFRCVPKMSYLCQKGRSVTGKVKSANVSTTAKGDLGASRCAGVKEKKGVKGGVS